MTDEFIGKEKREFLRYDHGTPISFSMLNSPKEKSFSADLIDAISQNLSASGLLFVTKVQQVPDISSLLILDLDYRTASICQEIEKRALIVDNKILGRVVRIEDNEDGTCGVGVAFVTKTDPLKEDVKDIANYLKK